MKLLLLAAAVALLCGCNANLGLQIGHTGRSATQPSVGPGGSLSSGGVNAFFGESVNLGTLLGLAAGLGWLFNDPIIDEQRLAPALDRDRNVNEQDCTKPLQGTGNLRCN
jgi:hypothetical protein